MAYTRMKDLKSKFQSVHCISRLMHMHYSVCYICAFCLCSYVCSAELMLPISRCSRVWSLHRQISVRGTLHNQASFYGWPSHQWKGQPPVGDSCHLCVRASRNTRQNISLSLCSNDTQSQADKNKNDVVLYKWERV